ncbi:MAG TPA: hypothetical protein DDZ90_08520 [Planctomycetaceae bacterium]|nr:hypothetical protein [Gimesia sp.]HBL43420.1 hypothetical protein [Planctomycetaceae bacterium]
MRFEGQVNIGDRVVHRQADFQRPAREPITVMRDAVRRRQLCIQGGIQCVVIVAGNQIDPWKPF